jgi:hypothetical protein
MLSSKFIAELTSSFLKKPLYSSATLRKGVAVALFPASALGKALSIFPEKMQDSALLITHIVLPYDLQRRLRANTGSKHESLKVKMVCACDSAEAEIEGVLSNRGTSDAVFQSI